MSNHLVGLFHKSIRLAGIVGINLLEGAKALLAGGAAVGGPVGVCIGCGKLGLGCRLGGTASKHEYRQKSQAP